MAIRRSGRRATSSLCVTITIVQRSLRSNLLQRLHDLRRVGGIEVSGGLVRQQHGRLVHEGAGDGGALHLAAGELVGKMRLPGRRGPTRSSQSRAAACADFPAAIRQQQGQGDIFQRRQRGQEIEKLEDDAEPAAAVIREFRLARPVQGEARPRRARRGSACPARR